MGPGAPLMDKTDITPALAKTAVPAGISIASLLGMPLSDLVLVATLIWIGLQSAFLIWKWVRLARGWKKPEA